MSAFELGAATSADLAYRPGRLLVLPLGSTEQHGPHLPLDTDTRIATAWAQAVADRLPGAVVAPALAYGSSGEHQSFPGTLSMGREALQHVLVELIRSATCSFDAVALLCGHAGNHQPVVDAVVALRREGHRVSAHFPHWQAGLWPPGAIDAHAGRTETSLLMHLAPETVRVERAEPGASEPIEQLMDQLRRSGVAAVSDNGVLGDPSGASAAEGQRLLADLVSRTSAQLATSMVPTEAESDPGDPTC